MILRKPFAILIKYFKMIHMVLAIFSFYLIYRTNLILSFLSEYMGSHNSVVGKDLTRELYNGLMYASLAIIIIGTIVVLGLMMFKQKKVKLYIYNIFTYVTLGILFAVSYSVVSSLEIELVDIRTLKMIQDLLRTSFILQVISLILIAVRATGFNVQKFNFTKDLQELEIEDIDSEEFEVNIDVDYDDKKRKLNRILRHTKYIYKENKVILWLLAGIIFAITSLALYMNYGVYNKVYKKGEAFSTNFFTMQLNDSYSSNKDYKGNEILEEESFIIIRLNIKNNYAKERTFDAARLTLNIDEHYFYHQPIYKMQMFDIGNIYKEQNISQQFTEYAFIYKIPTEFLDKKIYLVYNDYNSKQIKISVTPTSLEEDKEEKNYSVGETINFENSVLKNVSVKIDKLELAHTFRVDYDFCIDGQCYPSYEYLRSTLSGNQTKILMKVKGTLTSENSNNYENLLSFMKNYGYIEYQLNGQTKIINLNTNIVKPTKTTLSNEFYIETLDEIKDAEIINVIFKIRNKTYKYNAKY